MTPLHPGRAIAAASAVRDLEAAEVAVALGIPRNDLLQIVRGKAGITPELAQRLAAVLGGTAQDWQKVQDDYLASRGRRTT